MNSAILGSFAGFLLLTIILTYAPLGVSATGGCDGSNSTYDACGVCNGTNTTCAGCDNVANSGVVNDACGVCGGNNSTCLGCNGVPNGPKYDACGVCGGTNSTCMGCNGVPNSGAKYDGCGVCGGNNSTCMGCNGVLNSGLRNDSCGVCGGNNSTCSGCDNVPNSGKVVDACGVCGGNSSSCPCDFNATLSCTGHGACNGQYKCVCNSGWAGSSCNLAASVPITLTVTGTPSAFNASTFSSILAAATNVTSENIVISGVAAGTGGTAVTFNYVNTGANPTASTAAVASLNGLATSVGSTTASPLNALGVISIAVTGQAVVVVQGLVLTCDMSGCPRVSNIGAAFNPTYNTTGAKFTPRVAGNYTFQVSVRDRCWAKTQQVTVNARCNRVAPFAAIVKAPNPINYNTGNVVLDGTSSYNGNRSLGLVYKWCITSDPKGSEILNDTMAVASFKVGTVPGTYNIRLLVSDGCSIATADSVVTFQCNCVPNVRIGEISTITATDVSAGSASFALVGTSSVHYESAIGRTEPVTYAWSIVSKSNMPAGTVMTTADVGSNRMYYFGLPPLAGPINAPVTNSSVNPISDTSVNATYPAGSWVSYPKTLSTTLKRTQTIVSRSVTDATRTTWNTVYTPTCTATIANFNTASATLTVDSYKNCQGLFVVQLRGSDGCAVGTTTTAVSVSCNRPPSAVAGCAEFVEWRWNNPGGASFPKVYLDGRMSKDTAGETLTYSWMITAKPTGSTISNQPMSNGTNFANFVPDVAGTYTVQLTVSDGCNTNTDTVSVSANCYAMTAIITSGMSFSGANNAYDAFYQSRFELSAATSTYSVRGNRESISYGWAVTTRPLGSVNAINTTANASQATTMNFTPDQKGLYIFSLTLSDGCSTSVATIRVMVICPTAWTAITVPTPVVTPSVTSLVYNYTGRFFPSVNYNLTVPTPNPARTLTYRLVVNLNGAASSYGQGTFGSASDYTLTPAQLGTYTFTYEVTDGCNVYTATAPSLTTTCGTAPTPIISPTTSAQTGVVVPTSGNVYTVSYNTTNDGFYSVALSCFTSTVPSSASNYQCQWSWDTSKFQQIGSTATNGNIVLRPTTTATSSVSLWINDGCPASNPTTVTVQITPSCPRGTLPLTSGSGPTVTQTVNWDFATAKFPTVTLNGAITVPASFPLVSGDLLTYTWTVVNTPGVTPTLTNANTATPTFVPPRAGTFSFSYVVTDGCVTSTYSFVVNANCAAITAVLNAVNGNGYSAQDSGWNGNSFKAVSLSGTTTGVPLNPTLWYTWHILSSPTGSMWGSTGTTSTSTTALSTTYINSPQSPNPLVGNGWTTTYTTQVNRTIVTTTTVNTWSTLETLSNTLDSSGISKVCFVPDVPGEYTLRMTVDSHCVTSSAQVRVATTCNGAPTVRFAQQTQTISLNGIDTTRVYVDASATTDPDSSDTMTYSWTVTGPAAAGSITVANSKAAVASFVPEMEGTYTARVDVSDGCQTVFGSSTITVNCNSDMLALTASPLVKDVVFEDGQNNNLGSFPSVVFSAMVVPTCNAVTQYSWTYVSQVCSVPFIAPPTTPAPTPAPTAAPCTNPNPLSYTWTLLSKPCDSARTTASIGTAGAVSSTFTPDKSGTYVLQLSVTDSCSTSTDTTTLVARCTRQLTVNAGSPTTVLFECNASGFPQVNLAATASVASAAAFVEPATCPVATPAPTSASPSMPQQPQQPACCPGCAACAACPGCPSCQNQCVCPPGGLEGWSRNCTTTPQTTTVQVPRTFATLSTGQSAQGQCGVVLVPPQGVTCTESTQIVTETQVQNIRTCRWVNVPIPGKIYPYAPGQALPPLPGAKRNPSPLAPIRFSLRQTEESSPPENVIPYDQNTYYLPGGVIAGVIILVLILIVSIIVNIIYIRKIRVFSQGPPQ